MRVLQNLESLYCGIRWCRSLLKYVDIQRGDLVRWIIDYKVWEPPSGSDAFPVEPLYAYGIVIEVSFADPNNVVVACFSNCHSNWQILHMIYDGFEVLTRR